MKLVGGAAEALGVGVMRGQGRVVVLVVLIVAAVLLLLLRLFVHLTLPVRIIIVKSKWRRILLQHLLLLLQPVFNHRLGRESTIMSFTIHRWPRNPFSSR